ncbi:twin-arginine translocase TatA/TatE family subunit [Planococcus sp. 1R117A]|uniref:twin-arginine translocase TatA/TatE family subunit n=1 Tax=Planococcus sp. 1R117A TaxID=3447020 RepID=UPI003EDC3E99
MANIGATEWIIILVIALLLFGPAKLPQLGRAVGETLREFKNSTKGIMGDVKEEFKIEEKTEKEK